MARRGYFLPRGRIAESPINVSRIGRSVRQVSDESDACYKRHACEIGSSPNMKEEESKRVRTLGLFRGGKG